MYTGSVRKFIKPALIGLFSIVVVLTAIGILGSRVNGFGVRRTFAPVIAPNVATISDENQSES